MDKTKQVRGGARATVGAQAGRNAVRHNHSRLVHATLKHTRNGDPKTVAQTLGKKAATDGDVRNFLGHLFEKADIAANNARTSSAPRMTPAPTSTNPVFDATRMVGGKHQLIDQKFSAGKAAEAARKTSNPDRVFRVPKDQISEATRRIDGHGAVESSKLSQQDVTRISKNGLKEVGKKGAPNAAKVVGSAAAVGAVVNVAIGAVGEAGALKRGELSKGDFAVNRTVDAVDGAVGGAAAAGAGLVAVSMVAVVGTGGIVLVPVAAAAVGVGATSLVKVGTKRLRRTPTTRTALPPADAAAHSLPQGPSGGKPGPGIPSALRSPPQAAQRNYAAGRPPTSGEAVA